MPTKQIQTVLGPIDGEQLGITSTHEHLSMDFSCMYIPPTDPAMADCPYTLENSEWIRRNPFSHRSNLLLNDDVAHQAIDAEMKLFKKSGGQTIVENTTTGIKRNIPFLRKLASEHGINVIAGAGFYVANSQNAGVLQYSTEKIASIIRQEMTEGCDETESKCGVIGEIASVYPIEPFEKRNIKAAAIVQQELDCPVIVHPHRVEEAPFEVVRLYLEAGGAANKLVMSHLDRTLLTFEKLVEFAGLGTYMEFDMFGIECSHYQLNHKTDMPSDAQRIQLLRRLVDEGFDRQIVIAHDVFAKHRLAKFGGHGYSHILNYIVPKMLQRGLTQQNIDTFLKENPKTWLTS